MSALPFFVRQRCRLMCRQDDGSGQKNSSQYPTQQLLRVCTASVEMMALHLTHSAKMCRTRTRMHAQVFKRCAAPEHRERNTISAA